MQINLEDMTPRPEINRDFKNAQSCTIIADGKAHDGMAMVELDDANHLTITVGKAKKAKK